MKHFLQKILSCMFVCITCAFGAIDSANAIAYPFSVTTTNIQAGGTFTFKLSARGSFDVLCGDGGTLSGTSVSGIRINKANDTNNNTYTCKYSTGGVKTIQFGVWDVAQYNATEAAISFASNNYVASISGSLSSLFPYRDVSWNQAQNRRPNFKNSFYGCTNLTSISDTLFSGYTGGVANMFYFTFGNCSKLTSIPENLFSSITTGASQMFYGTFLWDRQITGYVPPTLFSGLIANGSPMPDMMTNIFALNSQMATSCPTGMQQYITGYEAYWTDVVSCEPARSEITYDCGVGGGTAPTGDTVMYGASFTPAANSCTTPVGYTDFVGWAVSGTNDIRTAGTQFTWEYEGNKTLTAQWTPMDYTVSFAAGTHGSGSMSSQTNKHVGDTITLPANEFTPSSGYVFNGWSCDNSIGAVAAGGTFTMPAADIACTAQWTPVYTVTYSCSNGTGTPIDSNSPYIGGATVTALTSSACTALPGDHFNYWDCGSVGGVSSGGTFTMPSANVTCMAAWSFQLFGVRFAAGVHGSGNMPSYTSIRAREQITLPSNGFTVNDGYTFSGWNCNNNIGDKAVGETFSMPAAEVTCTAQWALNTVNLTWYGEDGTTTLSGGASSCTYGGTITPLPTAPAKPGYHFTKWKIIK